MKISTLLILLLSVYKSYGQTGDIKGKILYENKPVPYASIGIVGTQLGTYSDSAGNFKLNSIAYGSYKIKVSSVGYISKVVNIEVKGSKPNTILINLQINESQLNEVVITGTMKESFKSESPVPVEVITSKFFLKNPTPSIFEAMSMVNGVQPQLNCNVCNTGDIHINGMEGPYTMITIDGMPIVSALSTVYGLSGIPNSMVQRVEVVKGPASTLYGSEAVGGLINIITKNPQQSPKVSVDIMSTSNLEINNDFALRLNVGKNSSMLGVNYFKFGKKIDRNDDNFTDLTLQDRVSVFNKWTFARKEGRQANIALRYVYEDRWGGEMQWNSHFRGGDSIYGESIYTKRYEAIGKYDLPVKEKISLNFSLTNHHQNSVYGTTSYNARQNIVFAQLLWEKNLFNNHRFLIGTPFRYTFYDDNTVGTFNSNNSKNKPQQTLLPGLFVQDEIEFSDKLTTLAGIRYDFNSDHGNIFSPRISFKYNLSDNHTLKLGGGNGYRVVNLFTEDHAALSGSRTVVIEETLKPEQSYNVNLNYTGFINHSAGFIGVDASLFYTYFTNKIIGDFISSPDSILYTNLNGYAVSKGISCNLDFQFMFPLKVLLGGTYMNVYSVENDQTIPQLHAPEFSGNFALSYTFAALRLTLDYTGKVMSPMHLPVIENDFRPAKSPWFSIQNIQITKKVGDLFEIYGGAKNILNFVPQNPISRPFDPFEKTLNKNNGHDSSANPMNVGFDTAYNYAPVIGTHAFLGFRFTLK